MTIVIPYKKFACQEDQIHKFYIKHTGCYEYEGFNGLSQQQYIFLIGPCHIENNLKLDVSHLTICQFSGPESRTSLTFLHVLVSWSPTGRLGYSVYQISKPTNRFLHAQAYHRHAENFELVTHLLKDLYVVPASTTFKLSNKMNRKVFKGTVIECRIYNELLISS